MQSGIYKIRNVVNGKFYVGSAVYFKCRWNLHRKQLNDGHHHSLHLQRAWNKYGEHSFVFEIVELCAKEFLIEREQFYLDTLTPHDPTVGYNMSPTAGSILGLKFRMPRKAVERANESRKARWKIHGHHSLGVKHSVETRKKMSISQSGENNPMYGKMGSDNPNSKRVVQKTKNGEIVKVWDCMKDIYIELGFHLGNISSCCHGKLKSAKGFVWKFL